MMKTHLPYHLTSKASQGNAFTRHLNGEPSIFSVRDKPGPGVNQFAVKPPTSRQLEGKQQITFSRAGGK